MDNKWHMIVKIVLIFWSLFSRAQDFYLCGDGNPDMCGISRCSFIFYFWE